MNVYIGTLYKEVEYIQSSGTQYINTGYTGSSNTKIDTKLSITTRVGNYDFFYGSSGNGTGGQPCTFIQSNYPDNNKIRVVNYANSGSNKRYVDSINNLEYGKIYNIIHTNTSFIIDGVSQGTMSATTYTLTYPFWIFGVNNRGSFAQPCAMKLYSFKIYESGTLVRDFVPCYRVSDNVIGLFDKVENKFYANAGTGTFTKGNDVKVFQPELKNAYIGEVWTPGANTLAYYPLTASSTVNDMSGNNRNLTNNGATFGTYGGADCMRLNNSSNYLQGNIGDISQYSHTISIWAYKTGGGGDYYLTQRGIGKSEYKGGTEVIQRRSDYIRYSFWFDDLDSPNNYATGAWHNIVLQYNKSSNSQIMYIDGTKVGERNCTYTHTIYSTTNFVIGRDSTLKSGQYWNGYISNFIVESKLRTAQEVDLYYRTTKSNYGL